MKGTGSSTIGSYYVDANYLVLANNLSKTCTLDATVTAFQTGRCIQSIYGYT